MSTRPHVTPAAERFWRHVNKTDTCWLWTGANDGRKGYGVFGAAVGNTVRAHRFSYELTKGPIGDLWVLHHCDNPPCVNPDHLYLGDRLDNARDARKFGTDWDGECDMRAEAEYLRRSDLEPDECDACFHTDCVCPTLPLDEDA